MENAQKLEGGKAEKEDGKEQKHKPKYLSRRCEPHESNAVQLSKGLERGKEGKSHRQGRRTSFGISQLAFHLRFG